MAGVWRVVRLSVLHRCRNYRRYPLPIPPPLRALPCGGGGGTAGARAAPGLSAAQFLQGGLDVFFFFAAVEAFAGAVQFFIRQQFGELFLAGAVQFAVCLFEGSEDVAVQREVFVLVAVAVGFAVFAEAGEDVMREAFVCGQGGKACGFGLLRCLFGGDGGGLDCGFGGVFCRLFGFDGLRGVQFVAQGGGVFEVGAVLLAPVAQGGVVVCWVDFNQRPAEGEEAVLVVFSFRRRARRFWCVFRRWVWRLSRPLF